MRLTGELINSSLSYLNPLNERELDLRGHKIPAIENLGAVGDYEAIDFTDNDITTLANFPLFPRLQTLLCARNRITGFQPSLSERLPNLSTLVLAENNISDLADLDPLQGFKKLVHVNLTGNPVTKNENYRLYLVWRCRQIRFLDFQKVKDVERTRAIELFGTFEAPTKFAQNIAATRPNKPSSFNSLGAPNGATKTRVMKYTDKEKLQFQALIRNARSLAEVQKLEKALAEGRLPKGILHGDDAMDET